MRAQLIGRRAVAISAAVIMAGALVGMASGAATAATCVSWTASQPVNPSNVSDALAGVAVVTPCDVWAVGTQQAGTASQTLGEHWNGAEWTVASTANPGGSSNNNVFSGVAVRSSTDAWAVGNFFNGTADQTLIEALSGSTWKQVSSANPGGPANANLLQGVAITSASNAWSVGEYSNGTAVLTLIEHWNGVKWRKVTSPSPGPMESDLNAVAAPSAKNAWAVGSHANAGGFLQTLIEHWNGTSWKRVPSPDPGGSANNNTFAAVAANSASNAWAVGTYFKAGVAHPLIAHWNGKKWRQVSGPGQGQLQGVAIVSAANAWTVGAVISPGARTFIAHWNGKTWSKIPSPNLGSSNVFFGVAASSANNVWAVGRYNAGGPTLTLAAHCC